MNKKIANKIKLLISSLIPIFIGPILIHFGGLKEKYVLTILGVIVCISAVVLSLIHI